MRVITVARKPLAGSVAQTALKYGTGGLNIDGCRISVDPEVGSSQLRTMNRNQKEEPNGWGMNQNGTDTPTVVSLNGRWPANLILQHQPECQEGNCAEGCPVRDLDNLGETTCGSNNVKNATVKGYSPTVYGAESRIPGKEEISYGDSGSVARYFKQVKVSPESFRAEGKTICPICGKAYVLHPDDAEEPYLTRLCDGTR